VHVEVIIVVVDLYSASRSASDDGSTTNKRTTNKKLTELY